MNDLPGRGKQINVFATACYRVMLNIKCIDHVLNATVYSMTNTVPLIHLVKGYGMGLWTVLVSPCFGENVVATCKIGSFCVV